MRRARPLLLAPCLVLAACGASVPQPVTSVARSALARAAPAAPAGDVRTLAAGAFAGRLYAVLAPAQRSFALSPFSISQALAMTAAGARGATLDQLRAALDLRLPAGRLDAAANALDQALASRQTAGLRLEVANSLWGQSGLRFEPAFLDTLARDYGAGVQLVDYRADPEAARGAINRWVGERTHGKIPQLLGALGRDTRLVLVDAVYLKADWEQPFDPQSTADGPFHAPGGDVTAHFMHRTGELSYVRGAGYQAVELPYKGGNLAMDLIAPDAGRLPAIERRLGRAGGLDGLLRGLRPTQLALGLPKVDIASEFDLGDALRALGARDLFSARADLSGITTAARLQVSRVVHKVKLTVDEKGTEAAAATGVVAVITSTPLKPAMALTIDHPFLLAVRDRPTGAPLFLGRVSSP